MNPISFNPPLGRLDKLIFTWYDVNGTIIDNSDCEWNAVIQIVENNDVAKADFKNGILKTETQNEGVILKGVNKDYDFDFLNAHLIEGKLPDFTKTETSKEIFISKSLADKLDLKLSQKLLIYFISQHAVFDSTANAMITKYEQRSRSLTICGIFKTDFADFDDNLTLDKYNV